MLYSQIIQFLRGNYYTEVEQLHRSGDFKVLGDTLLVWPVSQNKIYRLSYLGEQIEAIEIPGAKGLWQKEKAEPIWLINQVETEHGNITPDQYLVHPYHGVGIFESLETRVLEGELKTFASLRYADNDRILFPIERSKELMPYYGGKHPRLTKLHSKSWQRTKEKVQKDLIGIARGLIQIYIAREKSYRPVFHFNHEWDNIIAAGAGFELTKDQHKAWGEIKADLFKSEPPMDRLICGDVGFGKTELALRAAAQVIASGKQVALIAPTTILTEQHYTLIKERFKDLPIQVGHLSRLTKNQEKSTITDLALGRMDMVVGTHRLLSKDIQYKDLGLLIVDEEQKFGVDHKERLKKLRPEVDVLSLSATPIPRTLYMSLSGLRGLSTLSMPPIGRLPIKTQVIPYSEKVLQEAISSELARGGQIYVVHNRVTSLEAVRQRVVKLLGDDLGDDPPEVLLAHGQMGEVELANTMSRFMAGEVPVLVASTIVENGLDAPGANTLIVMHSERFGLSDLYQLRGRVGRRKTQAYAYFMVGGIEQDDNQEIWQSITESARQRLAVLEDTEALGSGWYIAIRDLEIRGGGNLLGHEQHGNMEAIGILLYSQLLKEEIGRQALKLGLALFQKDEKIE